MNLHMDSAALALKAGQFVTLEDACGTKIRLQDGTAWVTEEGDPNDFTLFPGEAHTVTHAGRTVVQAMNPARIVLVENEMPCANEGAGAVTDEAPAWYSGGMRALSGYLASLAEDFERKALFSRVAPIDEYESNGQFPRSRLNSPLGHMLSEPRYF